MRKLTKPISLLLILVILFGAIGPLNAFAEEPDASNTVTIDPFEYDSTYGDFARYIDITAEVNGEPVVIEDSSFHFEDFSDVITIRASLKEEWHNFPCHVTGIIMTYETDDDPASQELDTEIINEYRDIEAEFQHDGDVHISFTVDKVYKVLIEESDDGEITADRYRAKEGDIVHVDVTPTNPDKPYYEIIVMDEMTRRIDVDENNAFIMPGGSTDVTVDVVFFSRTCSYMYRWWNSDTEQVCEEERWLTDSDDLIDMATVSDGATLQDGKWYFVGKNKTFKKRIYTDGDVNLILGDGATLTLNYGIEVNQYSHLSVYDQYNGTGKMVARRKADDDSYKTGHAVIGGAPYDGGDITFYGGNIDASIGSAAYGACIGGGQGSGAARLIFYAGTYKLLTNSGGGACIGGGENGPASWVSGEAITFYGGDYEIDSYYGAGIGTGSKCNKHGGAVAIYGGTFKIGARNGGACIGGGRLSSNDRIDIYGGSVNALSTVSEVTGAGIGSGGEAEPYGAIVIHGGVVTSISTKGAGIGGSASHSGGDVYISGGVVLATSTHGGAGIGGGNGGHGGTVNISGGSVTATSSSYDNTLELARDLAELYGRSRISNSPEASYGAAAVVAIAALIDLFRDNEYSGAGIGGGHGGSGGTVNITGGAVEARCGLSAAQAIGRGKKGGGNGNLTIDSMMKVKAGSNADNAVLQSPYERINACRSNQYAMIEPCDHPSHSYECVDENYHKMICSSCAAANDLLVHEYDSTGLVCSDCGFERVRISFNPGEGSGAMADEYVAKGGEYSLPSCGFTPPQGKTFCGWKGKLSGSTEIVCPSNSVYTLDENITLTAQWTEPYQLWVGGIQVTDTNQNDILGDGSRRITYDPNKSELHFNDYAEPFTGVYSNALIYAENMDLTITGKATLDGPNNFQNGINIRAGSLTIDGDITLRDANVNAVNATCDVVILGGVSSFKGGAYGVRAGRNLYIHDTITRLTADGVRNYAIFSQNSKITIDHALAIIEMSSESRALTYENARHIVFAPGSVVTFKLNGGKWNGRTDDITKTIQNNTAVEKPDPDPERSGYVFGGWYADAALTTTFDFTQPIAESTVLYAGWKRVYSVEMYWRKASESEAAPDSVDAVLQHESNGQWTTVDTVTLNAANSWKARFTPALFRDGDNSRYRIRELDKNSAVVPDKNDDNGEESPTAVFNVGGKEKGYLVKYVKSSAMTEIINYSYIEYSVEKIWDTDRGNQDHPDDLDVVLQKKKNWYTWEAVELLTLNAANNLSGKFKPVPVGDVNDDGEFVKFEYRIRELEAEDDDDAGGQPAQPQTEEEKLEAANGRVVHDKWDFDKPILDSVLDKFKDPETYLHFEPELDWVKDQAKDILIPSPSVEFEVDEYTDAYGVKVEKHTTKYNVKYELNNDKTKMTVTDLAVLDIKVHSWWINFKEEEDEETGETKSEKPDSCYVMLESKVQKDYLEKLGEAGEYADIYTPCFSAVSGGYSLDKLPGVSELKDGVTTGIQKLMGDGFMGKIVGNFIGDKIGEYLKTGVAIAKQDGEATNPLNRWYTEFTVKKYGMGELKVPMDYAATELITGLIELVIDAAIKYFQIPNVHVPVMYQPIDQYWSVKGYGIGLGDTKVLCNIINTKFHGDDDNLGTVISGMKYWKDDKEEDRPDSIKIHVYYNKDGTKTEVTGSPVTVNKSDNSGSDSWPWSLEIAKGDDASEVDKENFIIEEENVSGYTSSVSGYDITNTKSDEPDDPPEPPAPQTGKLRITATRSDSSKEQAFVYNVTGPDNITLTAAVVLGAGQTSGSVTIAELPAGIYTVTEEKTWSWRYSDGGSQPATVGSDTTEVAFDHTLDKSEWLSGCSHQTID